MKRNILFIKLEWNAAKQEGKICVEFFLVRERMMVMMTLLENSGSRGASVRLQGPPVFLVAFVKRNICNVQTDIDTRRDKTEKRKKTGEDFKIGFYGCRVRIIKRKKDKNVGSDILILSEWLDQLQKKKRYKL